MSVCDDEVSHANTERLLWMVRPSGCESLCVKMLSLRRVALGAEQTV